MNKKEMFSYKRSGEFYQSASTRAYLNQTPFMAFRSILIAALIASVVAYYFYTREEVNTI